MVHIALAGYNLRVNGCGFQSVHNLEVKDYSKRPVCRPLSATEIVRYIQALVVHSWEGPFMESSTFNTILYVCIAASLSPPPKEN